MKKKITTILIIISLLICSMSSPILAENQENNNTDINTTQNSTGMTNNVQDLETQHNEVTTKVDEANEQLEGVQGELSELMLQIQELDEKIDEYEKEINSLGVEADTLKESIDKLQTELEKSEEKYQKQKEAFETRMVALYEAGETTYLDVLLQSSGIGEFLSNYYIISEIASLDEEMLEEIELEKLGIETVRNTLEAQREQYKVAKDNREKTAIILENTRIVKNNYINKLKEEEKQLQEQIDLYNKEIKDIEAEILMLTTANIGTDYVGGAMAWPVPGYTRISSPYGMRVHPITKQYKLHTGTDISAPLGANFIAANSGIVIKAEYNKAYGNMVIIDHGGGVSTLYAHGTDILVSLGQTVQKGQAVLTVGSTGYSTGAHAHFEVRINGQYLDPMNFVRPD